MRALMLLLLLAGCPHTDAPTAAPAAVIPPPPPPPPLPPRPSSVTECPAGPVHGWSALTGPRRVDGVVSYPGRDPDGRLYEVALVEPTAPSEWVEVTTDPRRTPEGTPGTLGVLATDLTLAPGTRVVLDARAAAGADTPRVELAPGAHVRVTAARDGRLRVVTLGGALTAEGWIDATSASGSWTPCPFRVPGPNRFLAPVAAPVAVRDAPAGRVLAELSGATNVLAVASDAPAGWTRIVAASPSVWVDGYVPADTLVTPGG